MKQIMNTMLMVFLLLFTLSVNAQEDTGTSTTVDETETPVVTNAEEGDAATTAEETSTEEGDSTTTAEETSTEEGDAAAEETSTEEGDATAEETSTEEGDATAEETSTEEGDATAEETSTEEGDDAAEETSTEEGDDAAEETSTEEGDDAAEETSTEEGDDAAEETDSEVVDEEGNPTTQITLEFIVEGHVYDESDQVLSEVEVNLGEMSVTSDENGYYQFVGLEAGVYALTGAKTGYVFESQQVTLDDDNPTLTVNLHSVAGGEITGSQMIVVGAYVCDANNIVSFTTGEGDSVYSFDPDFNTKGVVLSAADFDQDSSTDISVAGKGKGNDVAFFDAKGQRFVNITTNSDDEGANTQFGDLDGDGTLEIVVSQQKSSTSLYVYQADGTALRAIPVFSKDTYFNFTLGDVNGDGSDEIIVTVAKKTEDDNVYVFTGEGDLLASFQALAVITEDKVPGLVVSTANVEGDDAEEIIVAIAEDSKYYDYAVGTYTYNGDKLTSFNVFGNITVSEVEEIEVDSSGKVDVCHKGRKTLNISENAVSAHLAHGDSLGACDEEVEDVDDSCELSDAKGLLLTSGDLDSDGFAEIIVAKAGGREVRVYTSNGELSQHFNAVDTTAALSALSFGEQMAVELPVVEDLPEDPEAPLEDVTVIGTPETPVVIENRIIKGTVRIAYAVVVNVTVQVGGRLVVGPGVKFRKRSSIPAKLELTPLFPKINVSSRVEGLTTTFEAVDLTTTSVIEDAPPVLDDIKVVLGTEDVTQNEENGNIEVDLGDVMYSVCPVEVEQAEEDEEPQVTVEDDGTVIFITLRGQKVKARPVAQNSVSLVSTLSKYSFSDLNFNITGELKVKKTPDRRHRAGRPALWSEVVSVDVEEGSFDVDSPYIMNRKIVGYVFKDKKGKKRRQLVYPAAAYPELLTSIQVSDSNASGVELYQDGMIYFAIGSRYHIGVLDYEITTTTTTSVSAGVEFSITTDMNGDNVSDALITYPTGETQTIFLID